MKLIVRDTEFGKRVFPIQDDELESMIGNGQAEYDDKGLAWEVEQPKKKAKSKKAAK